MSLSILLWGYFARDLADMESQLTNPGPPRRRARQILPAKPLSINYKTEIGIIQSRWGTANPGCSLSKSSRRVRFTHQLMIGDGEQCPPYIMFSCFTAGPWPIRDCSVLTVQSYRRNRYMIRVKMMLMRIQVPNGK
jgi:hypothetical protein